MYVVCVTIWVKPGFGDEFVRASLANAEKTRREPGNVRFDVLRCTSDENQFFFYEVYRSEADFVAHQQTPHYLEWRAAVSDWMAQPRQGVRHTSVFPADDAW